MKKVACPNCKGFENVQRNKDFRTADVEMGFNHYTEESVYIGSFSVYDCVGCDTRFLVEIKGETL